MDKREILYTLLQLVPMGYVVSYSLLAKLTGLHPRAVAAYMRSNKRPLIIPCHRVVMSDGRLGGYSRGGPHVKKKLLELEGVVFEGDRVSKSSLIKDVDTFWRIVGETGSEPILLEDP